MQDCVICLQDQTVSSQQNPRSTRVHMVLFGKFRLVTGGSKPSHLAASMFYVRQLSSACLTCQVQDPMHRHQGQLRSFPPTDWTRLVTSFGILDAGHFCWNQRVEMLAKRSQFLASLMRFTLSSSDFCIAAAASALETMDRSVHRCRLQ